MDAELVSAFLEQSTWHGPLDPTGRTPLALAVRACVDSYWTELCSPAGAAAS